MRVCWRQAPITAQRVIDLLCAEGEWHPRTVKTLLNRLVKKRALGFTREGRIYHYHPLVPERDCIAAESRSFLDRIFSGALKPMLAHFIETRKLSRRELSELRRLLDDKEVL